MQPCKGGQHDLKVIASNLAGYDCEEVVRWCQNCGAVVVDLDTDGRTSPGYYRAMQFPKLVKELSGQPA